jgi:hypothetical protein
VPIILRNNDATIEIDRGNNWSNFMVKGSFDIQLYDGTGNADEALVYLILRSQGTRGPAETLDWREVNSPTVTSARNLADLIASWNITPIAITDGDGNDLDLVFNPNTGKYELPVSIPSFTSTDNSSNTKLNAGETFTGEWEYFPDGTILVGVTTDQQSAVDGLVIQWSADGSTVHDTDVYTVKANNGKIFMAGTARSYCRIIYTNGSTNQGSFSLETRHTRSYIKPSSHRIKDTITADDDAELVKSVPVSQTYDEEIYKPVSSQYPMPTDGDSIYEKDVDLANSDSTNWTGGQVIDVFNNLYSTLTYTGATNPKTITMKFKRGYEASGLAIGAASGNFSNVKIYAIGSGGSELLVNDSSADATNRTSWFYAFSTGIAGFIGIKIEFHTADDVSISNVKINKIISTVSTIQGIKPDGTTEFFQSTQSGNFKVSLEEFEEEVFNDNPLPVRTQASDSASIDAFGRWRVSNPTTLFDSKQTGVGAQIFWDDQEVSGTGTNSVYSENGAKTTISVSNATAGRRVRQTKQRFNYLPGKSQLILITFNLNNGSSGITKRVGYYDDDNGLFLESLDGVYSVGRRTFVTGSAVDNKVAKASWNIDVMDGTGVSGVTLDFTKTQILFIDFEWLGVGRVRMGFVVDGKIYYVHEFLNANNLADVYMSKPNLPVRYEIINDGTGATDSIDCICCSVESEGGTNNFGITRMEDATITVTSVALRAFIGIRLKSTELDQVILIETLSIIATTVNDSFRWELLLNPTVAGTFNYTSYDTDSAVETAIGASANVITGGKRLLGGVGKDTSAANFPVDEAYRLGSLIDGTRDEIVLAVYNFTNQTIAAVLNWRELL